MLKLVLVSTLLLLSEAVYPQTGPQTARTPQRKRPKRRNQKFTQLELIREHPDTIVEERDQRAQQRNDEPERGEAWSHPSRNPATESDPEAVVKWELTVEKGKDSRKFKKIFNGTYEKVSKCKFVLERDPTCYFYRTPNGGASLGQGTDCGACEGKGTGLLGKNCESCGGSGQINGFVWNTKSLVEGETTWNTNLNVRHKEVIVHAHKIGGDESSDWTNPLGDGAEWTQKLAPVREPEDLRKWTGGVIRVGNTTIPELSNKTHIVQKDNGTTVTITYKFVHDPLKRKETWHRYVFKKTDVKLVRYAENEDYWDLSNVTDSPPIREQAPVDTSVTYVPGYSEYLEGIPRL